MTKTPTPASHAVNTAPISADLRGIDDVGLRSAIGPLINAFGEAQWQSGRGVPHPDLEEAFEAIIAAAQAHALRAAPASPAQQDAPAAVLTKPARVGGGTFGIGVDERLVIEAAQRHYEYEGARKAFTPQQLVEQERKRRELWDLVHGVLDAPAAQPARECLQQSAQPQAWLVHIPSSDTQNVYDSQEDCGYIDDLTNNDDAVVTPLYAALQAAPPAPEAVAVPAEVDLPDVEDMAHSAVQEALSYGVSHDVFHRWMRAVMDKTVQAMAAAPAQASDTESVLIDGIAYRVPAAVAGELLSLHLDLRAAAPAQAVAVPEGVNVDAWRKGARFALEAVSKVDSICWLTDSMKEVCIKQAADAVIAERDRLFSGAPAQEHATQLAGQGLDARRILALADEHAEASRANGIRLLDMGGLLAFAADILRIAGQPAAAAPIQAQEDARDLEAQALRACRDLPMGWDIVIHLEKGCGSVVLIDPEFNENDLPVDGSLFDALKESIDQAVQADAARAAQGGAA